MANTIISLLIASTFICISTAADLPCSPRDGDPGQGQICVCNSTYCDTVERPLRLPMGQYHLYSTSSSTPGFTHNTGSFTADFTEVGDDDIVFIINSTIQYQEIKGFGASFTDSAGIVIDSLPPAAQDKLIESYFSTSGLEYSFCRMPIGGSDFSTRRYTLDDVDGDNSLEHFALQEEDYKYKIRYIKKAQAVCPYNISLLACSWSAPLWMKSKNHMYPSDLSGWLNMEHYRRWADYHVKFIQAYKENGVDIWGVSGGNEPLLPLMCEITLNNTLTMSHQQRVWLKEHLAPALRAANLGHVKYLTMEDTRIYPLYWMDRFAQDSEAYELVEGMALHWYFDYNLPPVILDLFHQKFPDKPLYYTESSVNVAYVPTSEAVKLGSWYRGALYMYNIIENLNHWAASYIDWNLALDPTGGPTLNLPVDASIIVNATSGEFYKNPLFYALGHFSKFIPPGSRRVDVRTNGKGLSSFNEDRLNEFLERPKKGLQWGPFPDPFIPSEVVSVATANSDGSNTIILMNNKNETARVRIEVPQIGSVTLDLEQNSLNSFVYWLE